MMVKNVTPGCPSLTVMWSARSRSVLPAVLVFLALVSVCSAQTVSLGEWNLQDVSSIFVASRSIKVRAHLVPAKIYVKYSRSLTLLKFEGARYV